MNEAITGAACFYHASSNRLRCLLRLLLCARTNTKTFAVSAPAAAASRQSNFSFLVKHFQSSWACETDKSKQEREEKNKFAICQAQVYLWESVRLCAHEFYFQIYMKQTATQLHAVAWNAQMLHSFINRLHLLVYLHQYNDDALAVCCCCGRPNSLERFCVVIMFDIRGRVWFLWAITATTNSYWRPWSNADIEISWLNWNHCISVWCGFSTFKSDASVQCGKMETCQLTLWRKYLFVIENFEKKNIQSKQCFVALHVVFIVFKRIHVVGIIPFIYSDQL